MSVDDLLVVGPAGDAVGGIARYIDDQRTQLGDAVRVTVHDTDTGMHNSGLNLFRAGVRSLLDFARFPLRERPDVVHVHTSYRRSFYRKSGYVLYAAHVWDRPVVLHVHGSAFDEFLDTDSPVVRALQRRVFAACDAVVALSPYWRDVLAEQVPTERIEVLPNAVDATEYDPQYERERPHVVFLSTLQDRKGIVEFVEAVDALQSGSGPRFDVTIAGRGPQSELAAELAADHEDVEYRGFVEEAEKRRLLSSATVYALPTYAEGLPFAILEAMAGGNAVVTTPVGSIPEVVGEENGRLVPVGDADALADALAELLASPELVGEMGRRNRATVVDEYSWARATDRLLEIYRSVADGTGGEDGDDGDDGGIETDPDGDPPDRSAPKIGASL